MSDITTIPVSKKFHDWLKSKGSKGESYEDILKRLLKPEHMEEQNEEHGSSASAADELLDDDSES